MPSGAAPDPLRCAPPSSPPLAACWPGGVPFTPPPARASPADLARSTAGASTLSKAAAARGAPGSCSRGRERERGRLIQRADFSLSRAARGGGPGGAARVHLHLRAALRRLRHRHRRQGRSHKKTPRTGGGGDAASAAAAAAKCSNNLHAPRIGSRPRSRIGRDRGETLRPGGREPVVENCRRA